MKKEALVGGSRSSSRSIKTMRARRDEEATPPPQIGTRFIAMLVVAGGIFTSLGYWKVNTVFAVKDYEIEAGRLQEMEGRRRDRTKALVARASQLQRSEHLRTAAMDGLGMMEPQPADMESLAIPAEVAIRWRRAAATVGIEAIEREER